MKIAKQIIVFLMMLISSGYSQDIRALYGFSKKNGLVQGLTNSEIASWLHSNGFNAIFGSYQDAELVNTLHDHDIKVFAEYAVFVGEQYWKKYPSSRPLKSDGKYLEKEGWYAGVNPVIPQIRREKLEGIENLVNTTKIDGIWLDFIRWPCHWEVKDPKLYQTSFDDFTTSRFCNEYGLECILSKNAPSERADVILDQYHAEWSEWKCEQILSFIKSVRQKIGSNIILAAFTVPWKTSDYNGAIKSIIGQDYQQLGIYLDIISPMVYHAMCNRSTKWINEMAEWVYRTTERPVWPIIQIVDEPRKISKKELEQAIQATSTATGSEGIIFFSMKHLDKTKLEIISENLAD